MAQLRLAMLAVVMTGLIGTGLIGCVPGAPQRASDIQNLNGISDDISAVKMTEPNTDRAKDPNAATTLPQGDEVHER